MTPAARDLLGLIVQRPIPSTKCELRPKAELLRGGYAEIVRELQNSPRNATGATFVRPMLTATAEGRAFHSKQESST